MSHKEILKQKLAEMQKIHKEIYEAVSQARKDPESKPLADLIDEAFFAREIGELGDDLKREATRMYELFGKLAAFRWTADSLNDPNAATTIHGEYASGAPKVTMGAGLPKQKKNPEKYNALITWLGMDPNSLAAKYCHPHWPSMMELITQRLESGGKLPPGCGKAYSLYKTVIRRKNRNG